MSDSLPTVDVAARAVRRLKSSHPWIYRDDVVSSAGGHGDLVQVREPRGRCLGVAFLSTRSKIALRFVHPDDDALPSGHWHSAVHRALDLRDEIRPADTDVERLLFGESDGIPGIIADRYGRHLVVQVLTAGAERILDEVICAIRQRVDLDSVLLRNDPSVRTLEGLPREVRALAGAPPKRVEVREHGVTFLADLWKGQKTGMFLDQRDNHARVGRLARGALLDVFSYQGGFAMHAAAAASVEIVEASGEALEAARTCMERNGRTGFRFRRANAFEDLRERARRGERFDVVVLDPPAFAKRRSDLLAALRGYKEINLRAMQLVREGGMLVTSSCSFNLSEGDFLDLLARAATDARRSFRLRERLGQSSDHPVRLGFPESQYLKCLVLSVM